VETRVYKEKHIAAPTGGAYSQSGFLFWKGLKNIVIIVHAPEYSSLNNLVTNSGLHYLMGLFLMSK
jgi:hypothetical protein